MTFGKSSWRLTLIRFLSMISPRLCLQLMRKSYGSHVTVEDRARYAAFVRRFDRRSSTGPLPLLQQRPHHPPSPPLLRSPPPRLEDRPSTPAAPKVGIRCERPLVSK